MKWSAYYKWTFIIAAIFNWAAALSGIIMYDYTFSSFGYEVTYHPVWRTLTSGS